MSKIEQKKSEDPSSKPDPRRDRKVEMLTSVSLLNIAVAPKQIVGVSADVSPEQHEQWVKQGLAKWVGNAVPVTPPEPTAKVTIDDVGGAPDPKPKVPVVKRGKPAKPAVDESE